mgnify:CR=1 FL=1
MACQQCGGLLVAERHLDFYSPSTGWKCVNCGWLSLENHQSRTLWFERRVIARANRNSGDRRNL